MVMKILLQNGHTRRYVAKDGHWSETAETALVFRDLAQARRHGTDCGLAGLRIVAFVGRDHADANAEPTTLKQKDLA